jgi:hypothetical protein
MLDHLEAQSTVGGEEGQPFISYKVHVLVLGLAPHYFVYFHFLGLDFVVFQLLFEDVLQHVPLLAVVKGLIDFPLGTFAEQDFFDKQLGLVVYDVGLVEHVLAAPLHVHYRPVEQGVADANVLALHQPPLHQY